MDKDASLVEKRNVRCDYRVARIIMLTCVSGSTAFGLSGDWKAALLASSAGMGTAIAGFYLDHIIDCPREKSIATSSNPLAQGKISVALAWIIVLAGGVSALTLSLMFAPFAVIAQALVLMTILLMSLAALPLQAQRPLLSAALPFLRACSLGILQALYAVMGSVFAGGRIDQTVMLAGFLFFAMTGGKMLGDVRDLKTDELSGTITIPRRFGLTVTRVFLFANEAVAYALGIAAFFCCGFGPVFLGLMTAIAVTGTALNIWFALSPTPERARRVNGMSLGILGMLYVAALVFEGL